jgi:hypothetical protein
MNKLLRTKKCGSAIALVLIALVILLVMGVGILGLGAHTRMRAVQASTEIAARCAADAGLTKVVFEMNQKLSARPWTDSNLPEATDELLPNCDATFSYTVKPDGNDCYTVECTGNSGRAEKKVNAGLQLQGLFDYAVFTQGNITLKNGTTVSSYNYVSGDETLKIGTNSTKAGSVEMKTGVTIDGDVIVGKNGNPDTVINSKTEASITGDTYAQVEERQLQPITVPAELSALSTRETITSSTEITGSAKYSGINLSNSGTIKINGPVSLYIVGDIILDNSAQLQIVDANTNPDASLTLYLGGNFVSKNGGVINNLTLEPRKLEVYGLSTCNSISFVTNSVFYGTVYAPAADVLLHNSVEFFGAVVSKNFIQDVFADFNYDVSLQDVSVNDEGVRFVVKQWSDE